MKRGILINDLELGYAPMSAYAFKKLITDKEFRKGVVDSHIYIIAQRREIIFKDFSSSRDRKCVQFKIEQQNNCEVLNCILPVFQEHIATDFSKGVDMKLYNRKNTIGTVKENFLNKAQGVAFQELDVKTNERKELIWFSPEKLLQNYWKGYINLELNGDYKKLLKYKVHYVGKSTEQNICHRLSNHSTFQEILVNQGVLTYGNIPSNEIVILLFRIKDNNTIMNWGQEVGCSV